MSILAAARLVPSKVQQDSPWEVGTLDLMSALQALEPPRPPMSIRDADRRREEFEAHEERVNELMPLVNLVIKTITRQEKQNADRKKAEEEEDDSNLLWKIARTLISEGLSGLKLVGTVAFRVAAHILTRVVSIGFSVLARTVMWLMANPWVAAGIGLVAFGFLGYKFVREKLKDKDEIRIEKPEPKAQEQAPAPVAAVPSSKPVEPQVSQPITQTPVKPSAPSSGVPASDTKPIETKSQPLPSPSKAEVAKKKAQPQISQDVKDAIVNASKVVDVPVALLTALAGVESSFGTNTTASTSSAKGLFQFIKGTWKAVIANYGKRYGVPADADPYDVKYSAIMAAAMIRHEGYPAVAKVVKSPSITDIYLTHFMGPAGGSAFVRGYLKNPDVEATTLANGAQVKANQTIFYAQGKARTARQVYDMFAAKLGAQVSKGESIIAHAEQQNTVTAQAPKKEPQQVAQSPQSQVPVGTPTFPRESEIIKQGNQRVRVAV